MRRLSDNLFLVVFVAASVSMLVSAPIGWNTYDIQYFIDWADVISKHGLLAVYRYAEKAAYPPLAMLTYVSVHYAAVAMGIEPNTPLYRLLEKIPLYIAYAAIALILRREYGENAGLAWMLSYIPYVVFNGYQFDLFTALGILLAHIYVYRRGKPGAGALWLGYAALYKHVVAVFAPLHMIHVYRKRGLRGLARYTLGLAAAASIVLPFLLYDPGSFLYKVLFFHSKRYPQWLSPWALPVVLSNYWLPAVPSLVTWLWAPFFALGYLALLYVYSRGGEHAGLYGVAAIHLWFLVTTKVGNPPYLLWSYPLLSVVLAEAYERGAWRRLAVDLCVMQVIAGYLYSLVDLMSAVITWGNVFLVEDDAWYYAPGFYTSFFQDFPLPGPFYIVHWYRAAAYPLFSLLYTYRAYLEALLIIVYFAAASRVFLYVAVHGQPVPRRGSAAQEGRGEDCGEDKYRGDARLGEGPGPAVLSGQ